MHFCIAAAAAAAKSLQSCLTLCNPIDGSPPGSPVPGKNTGVGFHFLLQCMKVKSESKVAQLCLTLSNPMDCSPPGSSIHGIFQARVLEWGAIAFSALLFFFSVTCNQDFFLKKILNMTLVSWQHRLPSNMGPMSIGHCPNLFPLRTWNRHCVCMCLSHSVMSDYLWPHGLYPPGSSVHGILQARILKWVAVPFSRGSSQPRGQNWVSCIAGRFFTM